MKRRIWLQRTFAVSGLLAIALNAAPAAAGLADDGSAATFRQFNPNAIIWEIASFK